MGIILARGVHCQTTQCATTRWTGDGVGCRLSICGWPLQALYAKAPVLPPTAPGPGGVLSHSPRLELWGSMTLPGAPWQMHDMTSLLLSTPCRMSDVRSGTWDLTHAHSTVKPPNAHPLGAWGARALHLWVAVAGAASQGSCARRLLSESRCHVRIAVIWVRIAVN